MAKRKLLKWSLLILLLLLLAVALTAWLCLDSIVRRTVETQATVSTNLQTRLDSARLSLLGGKVTLQGLGMAAPPGFPAGEFFKLKQVSVAVAYAQLRQQPVHIASIVIDSPYLLVEQQGGQLNVKAAMDGMPQSGKSSLRLVIDQLEVKNAALVVRPGLPLLQAEYTLAVPSLTLKNIGSGEGAENGAALKDVFGPVMVALLDEARKSGKLPIPLDTGALSTRLQDFASAERSKAAATQQQAAPKGLKGMLNKVAPAK